MRKWAQPQGKGRTKRALPKPEPDKTKRRGGKRFRKLKERLEVTEMRKLANRVSMTGGGDEYGDDAMGLTTGSLGKDGEPLGCGCFFALPFASLCVPFDLLISPLTSPHQPSSNLTPSDLI